MRSLKSRLSTGLLLSLTIIFSSLWILVSINIQYLAEEYIASRLEHDAENLLGAIDFDDNGNLILETGRVDPVYSQPFSGHYYVISSDQQRLSSRSLWDQTIDHTNLSAGSRQRTSQYGPQKQSLLVISNGYNKQLNPVTISIAENLDPLNQNITRFRTWFTAMALGLLLLLVILQTIILRHSLKPLGRIQAEIKSLEQGRLNKLSTDAPTELRPLINEVNHLLSVVEQRMRRSRDASGDLAHAIKKPLTIIQQLTYKSNMSDSDRDILIKQANNIYQITERILKRARLAGHSHSGSLFSFSNDLPDLIKTLEMMHAGKALQLSSNIAHNVVCSIDREDMLELLGNLLDNAYKWARHEIILSVEMNTDLHISIEDDGPGAEPGKLNELTKRGVRLDEKIEGHGMGLAIAADIITDYNGSIRFSHSDRLGGFSVLLTIPLTHNN